VAQVVLVEAKVVAAKKILVKVKAVRAKLVLAPAPQQIPGVQMAPMLILAGKILRVPNTGITKAGKQAIPYLEKVKKMARAA
jgi:hypothetical protein